MGLRWLTAEHVHRPPAPVVRAQDLLGGGPQEVSVSGEGRVHGELGEAQVHLGGFAADMLVIGPALRLLDGGLRIAHERGIPGRP